MIIVKYYRSWPLDYNQKTQPPETKGFIELNYTEYWRQYIWHKCQNINSFIELNPQEGPEGAGAPSVYQWVREGGFHPFHHRADIQLWKKALHP